jgi:hypothetical protein
MGMKDLGTPSRSEVFEKYADDLVPLRAAGLVCPATMRTS